MFPPPPPANRFFTDFHLLICSYLKKKILKRIIVPGSRGFSHITMSDLFSCLFFVSQALHQLYYDPNIENKNLAQKWLMQAQISPQAWQFCWALLSPDKVRDISTTCFCSLTTCSAVLNLILFLFWFQH